ncbi:uncharacterized protein [Watersipora subatra]|uniref:uncharacterized protein n=1 Tax=Watersipora subatra TaxID=2589382 RepID=UPI00355BD834
MVTEPSLPLTGEGSVTVENTRMIEETVLKDQTIMDPLHTGFTSSDSEPEIERRAEKCDDAFSNSFVLVENIADISLMKPGKGNSTIGLYGKDIADYSYAAGYSTIKSARDLETSPQVTNAHKKLISKPKRPVNSTLIGARYAKNVLDMTESPAGSPIPMKDKNQRRTIKTFGSPTEISKLSVQDTSPSYNVSNVSPAKFNTAKVSIADANVSQVSSADTWVTVEDSFPPAQVSKRYIGTPPLPQIARYKHHIVPLERVQEDVLTAREVSSLDLHNSLDCLGTILRNTCVALSSVAKDVEDKSELLLNHSTNETQVRNDNSPANVGQVPIAYSTPLHKDAVQNFQTPPECIERVENSVELAPRSLTQYTLSMFDEIGDSASMPFEATGSHGDREVPDEKTKKTEACNASSEGASVSSHHTGSHHEENVETELITIPEQFKAPNTATPSMLLKTGEHEQRSPSTQQRPVNDRVVRQKKLLYSADSAGTHKRLPTPERASPPHSSKPLRTFGSRRRYTTSSPALLLPPNSPISPHRVYTKPISIRGLEPRTSFSSRSPILLDVNDKLEDDISSDSVTEQDSLTDIPLPVPLTDCVLPTDHPNSFASHSYSINQNRNKAKIKPLKYPEHIQRQMDKMCLAFKKRNPELHEATKDIPCDILTCLPYL